MELKLQVLDCFTPPNPHVWEDIIEQCLLENIEPTVCMLSAIDGMGEVEFQALQEIKAEVGELVDVVGIVADWEKEVQTQASLVNDLSEERDNLQTECDKYKGMIEEVMEMTNAKDIKWSLRYALDH